jgi:DNA-binding NtrC family response regulator
MCALEAETYVTATLATSAHSAPAFQRVVRTLLVSPRLEVRKPLLEALQTLSTDVVSCSTRLEAEELLSHQSFDVVFCDEHLPDGSFADLIHAYHFEHKIPRIVVATRAGEWELYFEALRKGAFDVIRSPWHARDVQMTLTRALREEEAISPAV